MNETKHYLLCLVLNDWVAYFWFRIVVAAELMNFNTHQRIIHKHTHTHIYIKHKNKTFYKRCSFKLSYVRAHIMFAS